MGCILTECLLVCFSKIFLFLCVYMCVVLQKTTTATAQNRNKQKKHETRLCFLFVCCFLSCSCSFTWLGQAGYCASEMHHLFIATWADIHIHQCTTYMYDTQRDDWQQNLQGLASVERPLLICSEVMRWNSSNHFIKTSPSLFSFFSFLFLRHLCRKSGCVKSWWSGRSPVLIV